MSFLLPLLVHVLSGSIPPFKLWSVSWLELEKYHGFILDIQCLNIFINKRPMNSYFLLVVQYMR